MAENAKKLGFKDLIKWPGTLTLSTGILIFTAGLTEPLRANGLQADATRSGRLQATARNQAWAVEAETMIAATQASQPWHPDATSKPSDLTFSSEQLDRQLLLYREYLLTSGPPDILIVGSSRALSGIDPLALQEGLRAQGYSGLRVFNFSINGATAQVIDWLLRQLLTPDQLPQLIIWGDGVRAFNSGRIDHTYQKITTSQGHRALMAARSRSRSQPDPQACPDPIWYYFLDRALIQRFSTVLMATLQPAKTVSTSCQAPLASTSLPNPPKLQDQRERLGFYVISERFQPSTYFRRYPRVAGTYDGDYRAFNLTGVQHTALNRVLKFTQSQGIPLVYLNLPLTRYYMDTTRSVYEQKFINYMSRFDRQNQLIFRNFNQPSLAKNEYFMDPSHINQDGGRAIALELAKDSTIPWPQPWQKMRPDNLYQHLFNFHSWWQSLTFPDLHPSDRQQS